MTPEEKTVFCQRVDAGLNPMEACGGCGSGQIAVSGNASYCEECYDWEPNGVLVECRACGAEYRVIRREGCQKDGEERERAHREAAEDKARRKATASALAARRAAAATAGTAR